MDSILSSVLSIFSHNPIFVLGIIAYIAFSIIKNKNTEESDEYDEYESSSGGTWEDMEREYGISIERKLDEPSMDDLSKADDFYRDPYEDKPIVDQQPEAPSQTMKDIHFNEEAAAAQRDIEALSTKSSSSTPNYNTSKTRLDREAVTSPTLSERLAQFKRDKAAKEGQVFIENVGITLASTAPATTSTRGRKTNRALKEGMKWSIILSKPKALERRYR